MANSPTATRAAFGEAWKIQRDDGSWDWLKCGWGPFESDDHYGVTIAAIAAAKAPGNYAQTSALPPAWPSSGAISKTIHHGCRTTRP